MARNNPEDLHWYIGYVKSCTEFKAQEFMARLGYESYVPVVEEVHRWSDRRKVVRRLVLPRIIFVHTTEYLRRRSLEENPYLTRYMAKDGPYTAAVVPDEQMEAFRCMVDNDGRRVNVEPQNFAPGDKVKVTSGPLRGMVCELINVSGRRCLAVNLGALGTATMDLELETIEKI